MKKKKSKKVLMALLALIGFPLVLNIIGLFLPKRYTAEMRLLVDQTAPNMMVPESPYQSIDDISQFARPRSTQTQLDVLSGTDVLDAAIQMGAESLPKKIRTNEDQAVLYENLLKRMTVDNELNSDILSVKVTQSDPQVAAELANDIGLAYTDYVKRIATESGAQEQLALEKMIGASKVKLTSIDRKIKDLKSSSHIVDVASAQTTIEGEMAGEAQRLAEAQGQYQGSVAQLAVAEAELKTIPRDTPAGSHSQTNPVMLQMLQNLAQAKTDLADLRARYYDDFPDVKRQLLRVTTLEKQVKEFPKTIDPETAEGPNPVWQNQETTVVGLRAQVQLYAGQVAQFQTEYDKEKVQAAAIPIEEEKLQGLTRDRGVEETNYGQLEQREEQIKTLGQSRQPSARIVSTALPPPMPSFPDPRLLTAAGIAVGGFVAILMLMPRPEVPEVSAPSQKPTSGLALVPSDGDKNGRMPVHVNEEELAALKSFDAS